MRETSRANCVRRWQNRLGLCRRASKAAQSKTRCNVSTERTLVVKSIGPSSRRIGGPSNADVKEEFSVKGKLVTTRLQSKIYTFLRALFLKVQAPHTSVRKRYANKTLQHRAIQ